MRLRTHIPAPRTSASATFKKTQEKPKKTQEKPKKTRQKPTETRPPSTDTWRVGFSRGALWARTSVPPSSVDAAASGETPPTLLRSKIGGAS